MAKIDSAYDYYVSNYGKDKKTSRYDAHKKSDLRKIYNSIVKSNKESPLYKLSNDADAKRYAIDIKEHAKSIQDVVASLSDSYGGFSDSFQRKVAVSSDEDIATVQYVGDGNEDNVTQSFHIEVKQLATPQINTGNYLKDDALSFIPGAYSFDLSTNTATYEFQYTVNQGETNLNVLEKLSKLIQSSNLGISAKVISDNNGASALSLESKQTGLSENEESLFDIQPSTNIDSIQSMNVLGIHRITQAAANSEFRLNDTTHHSLSNTFTINNAFELTLNGTSHPNQPTTIEFKTNTDAVADNVTKLINVYNDILATGRDSSPNADSSHRLYREMSALSLNQKANLENIGLMVDENGNLSLNKEILAEAITPEKSEKTFHTLSSFKESIGNKAQEISLNPMNYVNKVVVAYKNPSRAFATPYINSIYSGLMMDDYT